MAERTTYVACHQCDSCGHIGINDQDGYDGKCRYCEWRGDYPGDDTCPSCGASSCIEDICPQCGGPYCMLIEDELDAHGNPGANRISMEDFTAAEAEYQSWAAGVPEGGK